MRAITTPALLALGLALGVPAASLAQTAPAPAPAAPAAQAAAAGDAAQVRQIPLTPALVDQFVAAKKEVDTVLDTLPDGTDQPDPATLAKLDAAAKKYKFDDYKQYDATENNIGIVMAGIDPITKAYVGPEAVIKKQISDVEADKQIPAKDKSETVAQLNAALATIPKLQYPGNVEVVTKNFDRLNAAMPQD